MWISGIIKRKRNHYDNTRNLFGRVCHSCHLPSSLPLHLFHLQKIQEMNLIVSRTGFCQYCKRADRPAYGNEFILHGTSTQSYALHECDFDAPFSKLGFTPFLFFKLGVEELKGGMHVKFRRVCSVIGCGIQASTEKDSKREMLTFVKRSYLDSNNKIQEYNVYYYVHRWKKEMILATDWNALVSKFKDESYWIDDRTD